jgi:uncharacterized damage-inducible protein DinB
MATTEIRNQLVNHLEGGEAFMPVDEMLEKISFEKLGERPEDLPYSFYELFYHIKANQKEILEYCTADEYQQASWPDDYWPSSNSPENKEEWENLKQEYFEERQQFCDHILDPGNGLTDPVRSGTEHSLLREALLVIEHSAYHTGQLMVLLRLLGLHS